MVPLRRLASLLVVLAPILYAPPARAIEREPLDTFRARRQVLAERHSNGVILLFGYRVEDVQSTRRPFRQENNFYYLTGWNEPGAALCLLGQGKAGPYREILFLPSRKPSEESWTGRRLGPDDPASPQTTGFAEVLNLDALPEVVSKALKDRRRIYTLTPRDPPGFEQPPEPDPRRRLAELAERYPQVDIRDSLNALRRVKSPGEVELIRKAVAATVAAQRAAWERISPGVHEYQLAGTMIGVMMEHGCLRPAYTPIIGSGENSTVLHYAESTSRLEAGDLVVMDVGGEYGHYAADITRTAPVSGRFTERQREIYRIVLEAQKAAIAAARPGMTLGDHGAGSLADIVRSYFNTHGKDQHGEPLGKYFTHGLGHHVGLEVHDPADSSLPLEPGMVVTIEPGLYLPEEGFGVRIEDMLLITEDGAEVLSKDLPKEVEEIEHSIREPHASASGGL